jgi:hypothetical protein
VVAPMSRGDRRILHVDGTYHNMMNKPVSGRDNLRKFIGGFIGLT